MSPIVCALCDKLQRIKVLYPATFTESQLERLFSARRLPDRIHYRIVRCERCGLIFSSPILPPNKIARLYRASTVNYDEQIPYLTKTYLKLFHSIPNLPKSPKVLEVGCGNGFFLEALYKQGITQVYGVEPGTQAVKKATRVIRPRITVDIFKKNQFPKNSFDVICCFHTLDHLVDPNAFLDIAYTILKPGGMVIIVVHDTDGLSVKLFGERSPIFDIEHIYLFNKYTLSELFKKHKFTTIKTFNLTNTYPLSYWLRMSGLPQLAKTLLNTALTISHTKNIPFSFPGGNITLIARKP